MKSEVLKQIEKRERVLTDITKILINALQLDYPVESIDPDSPLFGTGLSFDSVDAIEIIVALEVEYGVTISESEGLLALRSVNTLVDAVMEKQNKNDQ